MFRFKTTTLIAVTFLRATIPHHMPKVPSTIMRHGIRPLRCACNGRKVKTPGAIKRG